MENFICIKHTDENISSVTVDALAKLCKLENSTLSFENGEYHFNLDGTYNAVFAPTNNQTGEKFAAFPILNAKGLTIDGNGSTFVFHDKVFPFIIQNSENVTLKNFTCTTLGELEAVFIAEELGEDSFFCKVVDNPSYTYEINGGSLELHLENQEIFGQKQKFSFHSQISGRVTYLFTGDCEDSTENLPAPAIFVDAAKENGGVRFTYREKNKFKYPYAIGEKVGINFDAARYRDVFFIDTSKNTVLSEVAIKRGGGMGVIAQCSENITLKNVEISPEGDELTSTTADALHFVNCTGKLKIDGCEIRNSVDDACNIHGIYTTVEKYESGVLSAKLNHFEQGYFNPYQAGDKIVIINHETLDKVANAIVKSSRFADDSGLLIDIELEDQYGFENIAKDYFIELYEKMPDVEITNCKLADFPHIRISGGGKMLLANNHIRNCTAAALALDLSKYWYESGRINELVIRDNFLSCCNSRNSASNRFIEVGVSGYTYDKAPLIHQKVIIENNRFEGVDKFALIIGGLKTLVLKGNMLDGNELPQEKIIISSKTKIITE